jgi:hypothetical protein
MLEFLNTNKISILIGFIVISIVMIIIFRKKIYSLVKKLIDFIKEIMVDIVIFFIKNLLRLENYLSKNKLKNTQKIEDLTPFLSEEKRKEYKDIQETYLESLKFGVQNKNVINIALTGGFGIGKSTILNEFINKNRGYNFLRISLSNFNETNEKFEDEVIATSILQQIIYFEKKEKLKESTFYRIGYTKRLNKFFITILLLVWIYSFFALYFEKALFDIPYVTKEILSFCSFFNYNIFVRLFFIIGVIAICYKLFDTIRNFKINKVSKSDFEITNKKSENHLSVFNRNLEEIIYFFEKTDTNVVIIEDIDRFKIETSQKLFSKIRELSVLIKESKNITQPVKFIYAVKDELLTDTKTKFFDLIIPVLPIIDFTNSKNIFLDKLKDFFESSNDENDGEKIKEKNNDLNKNDQKENIKNLKETNEVPTSYLDKEFVSEVAYYISDMRTIINICNEYKIYYKIQTLNKEFTNQNKLFALIFYKNLFPEDFAKIQIGNSNLNKIFNREDGGLLRTKINDVLIKRINEDIEKKEGENGEIETEIDNIQNHQIKDLKELRKIYLLTIIEEIYKKNHNPSKIEGFEIKNLIENEEDFNLLKKSRNISYQFFPYNDKTSLGKSFHEIGELINKELSFEKREKIIKDFNNQKIIQLNKELRELYWEKNEIEFSSVQKLLEIYPDEMEKFINEFYEIADIDEDGKEKTIVLDGKTQILKKSDINIGLVKNLIRKGYLTEDFTHYLSFFHKGSLKFNDYKLLMRIRNNEKTNFNESIDNAKNLVRELSNLEFKNNNKVLIIDIFKELLINSQIPQKRNSKLNDFLYQVTNFNDESAKFLELFLKTILIDKKDNEIFSNFIVEFVRWDGFWLLISTKFEDDNLKRQILLLLFEFFNEISSSTIINLNKQESITTFVNKDADFLNDIFDKVIISSFIKILIDLNIKFEKINYNEKSKELLDKVYENNLFQINPYNFELFSKSDSLYDYDDEAFKQTNYSFLNSQENSILFKRVSDNLNEYLENVYLKLEENNKEKSSIIQNLLESEKVKEKTKKKIIEKGFEGKIKSIGKIKEYSIAELLFNNNNIECSWQTIIEFTDWENYDFDIITDFINNNENYKVLSINDLYINHGDYFGEEKEFYEFVYKLINNVKLKKVSFASIFDESDSLRLNTSKIEVDFKLNLNKEGKINSTKDQRIMHLIEKNFVELSHTEFNHLIKYNKKILIKLIEKNENEFVENISSYDFELDFLELLNNSSILDKNKIKVINQKEDFIIDEEKINSDFCEKIITLFITENFFDYSFDLYQKLLSNCSNEIIKIQFFILNFSQDNYDLTLMEDILEIMGEKFKKILNKEKVTFEATEINKDFLKILKDQQIINNFKKQKDNFIIIY